MELPRSQDLPSNGIAKMQILENGGNSWSLQVIRKAGNEKGIETPDGHLPTALL
jgi:hypothetical protein